MAQTDFIDEVILQRESNSLENLINVAARYQGTNTTLFTECMKEAKLCQQLIDNIKNKKDDEKFLEKDPV